jgi:hypothetical protein
VSQGILKCNPSSAFAFSLDADSLIPKETNVFSHLHYRRAAQFAKTGKLRLSTQDPPSLELCVTETRVDGKKHPRELNGRDMLRWREHRDESAKLQQRGLREGWQSGFGSRFDGMTCFAGVLSGEDDIADFFQKEGRRVRSALHGLAQRDDGAQGVNESSLETASEWWVQRIAWVRRNGRSNRDDAKILGGWYENLAWGKLAGAFRF